MGGVRPHQDLRQRRLGGADVHAAQHVVGAELDDQRVRPFRNAPVESRQPILRRLAGDPGVGDFDIIAFCAQNLLQNLGKRLSRRRPIARGETVAERNDMQGPRLSRDGDERGQQRK